MEADVGKVRQVRGRWKFRTLLPEAASLSPPRKGHCHKKVEALIQILLAIIGSKIKGEYLAELCVKCIEGHVLFRARIRCVQLHTVQWMTWNDSSLDTWAIKYPIKHLHASPSLYLLLPLSHFRPPLHLPDSIAMSSLFFFIDRWYAVLLPTSSQLHIFLPGACNSVFSLFLHSCPLTCLCTDMHAHMHAHTDKAARDKHGLKPRWPSVGQKHTLLLKSLLYPWQTKRWLHLHTVPTIRPWPGPFLFPVPSSLPPAHTPTVFFQHGAMGEWGTLFMPTCVHAGSLCQTLPLYNRRAKRLTSSFWRSHPHSDMNEHGCRGTPAPLCVCRFTVNARGVCLFWMTWKFGVKPEICLESGQNRIFWLCLTVLNFSR